MSFGEHEAEAKVDLYMIQAAKLRQELDEQRQKLMEPDNGGRAKLITDLKAILASGILLDDHLSQWIVSLPRDLRYEIKKIRGNVLLGKDGNLDSMFYDTSVHIFPNLWCATLWNRFRGTRLITNNIIAGTLAGIAQSPNTSLSPSSETRLRRTESMIAQLVTELCQSFPYYFGILTERDMQGPRSIKIPEEYWQGGHPKIPVSRAHRMTWPLVIMSATSRIEDQQRLWIKNRLMDVAKITSNTILDRLSKVNELLALTLSILVLTLGLAGTTQEGALRPLAEITHRLY